jgi:N,N'-diacetyllegionaminate synthase
MIFWIKDYLFQLSKKMNVNHTLIIAEAGVNHNGDIETAKKLIDFAAIAGADYVKFQTFKTEALVSELAKKAVYQERNTQDASVLEDTQFQMLKKLELTENDHLVLIEYCKSKNIKFLSTGFDLESLEFLKKIGVTLFKIPSGEINNLLYLEKVAKLAESIILSTGMSTMEEIRKAIESIRRINQTSKISILHCNTEYPTPYYDVNLYAMNSIAKEFNVEIGYSDHTIGIEVPIAAVALGAKIIEKHFTISRTLPGPDHAASLEPDELKQMIASIRNIELSLGSSQKKPTTSELKNIVIARKSIHLSVEKAKGEVIDLSDLIMLRPGDGISPMEVYSIIGKRLVRSLKAMHKLNISDFE